jgi:hypothetical protein
MILPNKGTRKLVASILTFQDPGATAKLAMETNGDVCLKGHSVAPEAPLLKEKIHDNSVC